MVIRVGVFGKHEDMVFNHYILKYGNADGFMDSKIICYANPSHDSCHYEVCHIGYNV